MERITVDELGYFLVWIAGCIGLLIDHLKSPAPTGRSCKGRTKRRGKMKLPDDLFKHR
jgi:hypothetical protein